MPKKVFVSEDDSKHVLFTELAVCERKGNVFFCGGRSKRLSRCGAMTEEYTRELVGKLLLLLGELDAERGTTPVMDGIDLSFDRARGTFDFTLSRDGKLMGGGRVTKEVALKAKAVIEDSLPPDNVVKWRRREAH